ncbi:MAG: response regulator [Candidatus Anammoxibacter sp.]
MGNILVIDKDKEVLDIFRSALHSKHKVRASSTCKEGIEKAKKNSPDIVFLDLKTSILGDTDTLHYLQEICPDVCVYMTIESGKENTQELKTAISSGFVYGVCRKPLDSKRINLFVDSAL